MGSSEGSVSLVYIVMMDRALGILVLLFYVSGYGIRTNVCQKEFAGSSVCVHFKKRRFDWSYQTACFLLRYLFHCWLVGVFLLLQHVCRQCLLANKNQVNRNGPILLSPVRMNCEVMTSLRKKTHLVDTDVQIIYKHCIARLVLL